MEPLDETAIRARTGSKVFARGEDYWKQGMVLSVAKRGESLHAKVEGSEYEPYRVTVRWQSDGDIEAICTCPYADEWGDWCKHIVAVLLEYSNEVVIEQEPLSEMLKSLSKQEILDLLVTVSKKRPEFYDVVVAVFTGEELEDEEEDY